MPNGALIPFIHKTSSLVLSSSVLVLHTCLVTEVRIRLVTFPVYSSTGIALSPTDNMHALTRTDVPTPP